MSQTIAVKVPDIGDFHDVPVIEVLVKPGDVIKAEDPLLMLESDKAAMEVPSPAAGVVREVSVKLGDKVSAGTLVLTLETEAAATGPAAAAVSAPQPAPLAAAPIPPAPTPIAAAPAPKPLSPAPAPAAAEAAPGTRAHASPSIRHFARELGVDVAKLKGSGPKGRILREDVQGYVKAALASAPPQASAGAGLDLLPWPQVDFAKFGPVKMQPLSRIQKISGANLHRNWVMIPHVTQFDEADITELEAFRIAVNQEKNAAPDKPKLTLLAFLIKAVVWALKIHPEFNASLDGEQLVLKQYCHIGFAADTPSGLVVPVIRDADKKGVLEIAGDMAGLAKKAREGKLSAAEMQGGCFSISSLGGIGGTAFTPIINAPEVAILGVSKSEIKPKWDGKAFVPRLTLPLSLSYDHRVIDGATAARFTALLGQLLGDMRRTML
ncbi:dihydrolipoyllysine-residue acetyltransferase component of pyruvate dehydrogenase complex [mine drainage metagenome]|uniref:Dihydrolipoyllysine-residue acetyltransferase component of pyruvate dehydrogenase complex n=1 Tax=mine drainage metagenome TaxID=410659 RepID=A0A1J5RDN8_9ZZZZ